MVPFKKIFAISFLGFHFNWLAIKRIFFVKKRGLNDFFASYNQDRIFALQEHWHKTLPLFSHCYQCKLCDLVCPQKDMTPSFLIGAVSRSLTDLNLYPHLPDCQNCNLCENICPQNVPIKQVIKFIRQAPIKA